MNRTIALFLLISFAIIQIVAANEKQDTDLVPERLAVLTDVFQADITTTGGGDLKGVRNPDLYSPTLEEMQAQTARVNADYQRGRIGYGDTGDPGWMKPVPMPELGDFGASRYDTDLIVNPQGREDVINQRESHRSNEGFVIFMILIPLILLIVIILSISNKKHFEDAEK